jgi:anaerobic dimethyl sulfoxide reductase subunit B
MKGKYRFYFDGEKCTKCYACEIACKQWHGIEAGTISLRQVIEVDKGTFPEVKRTFLSVACKHCAKAPCITSCAVNAINRRAEDGIIQVDGSKCNGCRACLEVCPFKIPQFDNNGVLHLCDMCLDRLEDGNSPICSDSCPTKALSWEKVENIL